jgi:hypothetical protein
MCRPLKLPIPMWTTPITMTKKIQTKDSFLIGVISDTHGHLPPEVRKAFAGVDLIIHAGDIGEANI